MSTKTIGDFLTMMSRIWTLPAPAAPTNSRPSVDPVVIQVDTGGAQPQGDEAQARNVARYLIGHSFYVPQIGWVVWEDGVWTRDDDGSKTLFRVRELIRTRTECALWRTDSTGTLRKATASLKNAETVLKGCQSDPRLVVPVTAFDADAYSLNTPAGLVDLVSGQTRSVRGLLVMKRTAVAPVAGPTPLWEKVLSDAFPNDPATAHYLETALGLALFGNQDVQQFWMLSGESGAGKGTILNTVMSLLGTGENGYAAALPMTFLMDSGRQNDDYQNADLHGKRLVVASEADKHGAAFSAARVKNLTGGDIIKGRHPYGRPFSFEPTWKLFLMTNYRPAVSHEDEGFWRRFREVPFRHKPAGDVIPNLRDRLVSEEGPAILARLIERARDFMVSGLGTPQTVQDATLDNRAEQDSLDQFIQHECDLQMPNSEGVETPLAVPVSDFYDAYEKWCKQSGMTPEGKRAIGLKMPTLGYQRSKSGSVRYYNGLNLSEQWFGH